MGAAVHLAGLTWKRRVHDAAARPRAIAEFLEMTPLGGLLGLNTPRSVLRDGTVQIEAQLAGMLPAHPVLSLDVTPGSSAVARSLRAYMAQHGIDRIVGVDAGGDALCNGTESTIRSPICDQLLLAALAQMDGALLAVHSFGTDGEMSLEQFKARFAALVAAGAFRGALDIWPGDHARLQAVLAEAKTESSRFSVEVSVRLADQERETVGAQLNAGDPCGGIAGASALELRGGSRRGELCALTAFTLFFGAEQVFAGNAFSSWWERDADVTRLHELCAQRGMITEFSDS